MSPLRLTVLILTCLLASCQTAYFSAWEKLGYHKRDILVSRVKEARDDQEAAKQQFQTTLERFRAVAKTPEDKLEPEYKRLQADYDRSATRAKAVTDQIASVQDVAEALFKEWQGELSQYSSADLRRRSEEELRQTRVRYEQLLAAMKKAESRMKPVLDAFHDQVLFMKHNLNARAIASLESTRISLESDVGTLIKEMETSIAEANAFIKQMGDAK